MKRIICTLLLSFIMLSGCVFKKKAAIFLSAEAIDPSNCTYVDQQPAFKQRQRIYFILLSKKPIESRKLRLQVLKVEKNIEPAYGIDIPRGPNEHYVTDYFTLHKAGTYFIRIFAPDNYDLPIAQTEFVVEEL